MCEAMQVFERLGLNRVFKPTELNPILKELQELSEEQYYLLGSKRSYYDFKDTSRIVWHAGSNWFEVQHENH